MPPSWTAADAPKRYSPAHTVATNDAPKKVAAGGYFSCCPEKGSRRRTLLLLLLLVTITKDINNINTGDQHDERNNETPASRLSPPQAQDTE